VRPKPKEPLAAACFIGLRPIGREYATHGLEARATLKAHVRRKVFTLLLRYDRP
jgi:hypothetical protein